MSVITDIILLTFIRDSETHGGRLNAEKLSEYLCENYRSKGLVQVDGYAGGNRAMQCDVFITAVNYLDHDEFIEIFNSIKWEYPESVQLLLKCEDCDAFEIITPLLR